MSNSLLEAMSKGCSCIVSSIQANQTLIKNGVNGLWREYRKN